MIDTEQLYVREGNEAAQGYTPMPMADAPAVNEQDELNAAVSKYTEARPEEKPIVERAFLDSETGKPRPENETIDLEDAARQLTNARQAEADIAAEERKAAIKAGLDEQAPTVPPAPASEAPAEAQAPVAEEQTQLIDNLEQLQPEAVPDNGLDPEIAQALQSPKVRNLLESTARHVEDERTKFTAHANALTAESNAILFAQFPELAGAQNADQLRGALLALNQSNPQRAQAFVELAQRAQQIQAVHQQHLQAAKQAEQLRTAVQFDQYAKAQDDAFEALHKDIPKTQMTALQEEATNMLMEYGMSKADIWHSWNNDPLFRSTAAQRVLADAARYRLAQKSITKAATRPVPQIQRPGASEPARDYSEASTIQNRFNLNPSKELGAALIAARRAARG